MHAKHIFSFFFVYNINNELLITMSTHKTRSQGQAAFKITIANRSSPNTNKATSSPFPLVLDLSAEPTVGEVKRAIQKRLQRLPPARQRLTTEEKRPLLDESKTLAEENVKTGDLLYLKDLGPQVAWRTVFLTEYAGPLLIQPILYHFGPTIWRKQFEYSQMQKWVIFGLLSQSVLLEKLTSFSLVLSPQNRFRSGHGSLCQARARDPLCAPLLLGHHAPLQHFP